VKISSRPTQDDDEFTLTMGSGGIMLMLDDEQMQLITALICQVRLGAGSAKPFKRAAYDLLDQIEKDLGQAYMDDACDAVDMQITVEDLMGQVIFRSDPNLHMVTLEV
jgi:hypothetical protein